MPNLEKLVERLHAEYPGKDNNYHRGKAFEPICKWFLENDPEYQTLFKNVWLWDDWPGRDGPDKGIDLVAELFDDAGIVAIQAKFHTESIPTDKIDRFMARSERPPFTERLLISVSAISEEAEVSLKESPIYCSLVFYTHLDNSAVDWLAYFDQSRKPRRDPYDPDPHQEEAVCDIIEGFVSQDRGQAIMACGTGKTLVGLWTKERLQSRKTLVVVPSLALISQIAREWRNNAHVNFHSLFVCSDVTASHKASDEDDSITSHTSELGKKPTTDPVKIKEFLASPENVVVFSTYHSSLQIAKAQDQGAPAFDIVIADEAHHCIGKVESFFSSVIDETKIRAHKRLFMTATPRNTPGWVRKAAEEAGKFTTSMDNAEQFGKRFHTLSFGTAIKKGLLANYEVIVAGVTAKQAANLIHSRRFVKYKKFKSNAEYLATMVLLAELSANEHKLTHVITFHNKIKQAKDFSKDLAVSLSILPKRMKIPTDRWTKHIYGKMLTSEKVDLIKQFRNRTSGFSVFSNARCLGEGVDIRAVDGILFAEPKRSQIDIIQAVGRAIRPIREPSNQTKVAKIIIPVFIEPDIDQGEEIDKSRFKKVYDVLRALKDHDDVLESELNAIRYGLGRRGGGGGLPPPITFDMPKGIGDKFIRALTAAIVESTTPNWEFWCGLLASYVETTNDANPLATYVTKDGHRLGAWVSVQRQLHKKDRLDPERVKKLDALGIIWDPVTALWEEGFQHLLNYLTVAGNANPSQSYVTKDGHRLGAWVSVQRQLHKKDRLDPERVKKLDALGIIWDPVTALWEEGFQHFMSYVKVTGNSIPIRTFVTDNGYKLGAWVGAQRRAYVVQTLSSEQIARLDALDFVWNRASEIWEDGFQRLKAYQIENGHSTVRKGLKTNDGFLLGKWVERQRGFRINQNPQLTPERIRRLDALGFIWKTLKEVAWGKGYLSAELFKSINGHLKVPGRYVDSNGYRLGQWLEVQRGLNKKDKLDPERVKKLDALGIIWDPVAALWEEGFQYLLNYLTVAGNANPSQSYVTKDGHRLGAWVSAQRQLFRKGKLSVERIRKLDKLGVDWNPSSTELR